MATRPFQPTRGFSLVEMLVVIGIIVLVTGLSLPAIMRARKAGRQTQCTNNLHEIGRLLHLYADQNNDYLPIGTPTFKHCQLPFRCGIDEDTPIGWRTDWNDFMSIRETPSGAMGAFLINGMIDQDNCQLLYCPSDQRKKMKADLKRPLFPPHGKLEVNFTIQIGYAVRPERNLYAYHNNCSCPPVVYPRPMPKLSEFVHQALVAEAPERPPYNHGSESSPAINVCYSDGAVRLVYVHEWKEFNPKPWFEVVDEPYPTNIENDTAMPVWQWLDKQ